jgi:5-methylcytosine-specific restriction enzyme subunit McrC
VIARLVTVREYAVLSAAPVPVSLDSAQVSEATFSWLCRLHERFGAGGVKIAEFGGNRSLRLAQYVGVLHSPDGTLIEILPKHVDEENDLEATRRLAVRLISQALDVPARTTEPATLRLLRYPLSEWVIQQFLAAGEHVIKRGVRFEYQRVEEESPFIRGQIDLGKQLHQPPGQLHKTHIRHEIYTPDRPENRLLKSALTVARRLTRDPGNWRLSNELLQYMEPVPISPDQKRDFSLWRDEKLMAHYRRLRPWCELLLSNLNPTTQVGDWQGISLLFPMDRLYERFVTRALRQRLVPGAVLTAQARSETLCSHRDQRWFQLQPDLLIQSGERRWILDTKWKQLDSALVSAKDKYNLDEQDFYQLFAYGQRYLGGIGDLLLIFPRTKAFRRPLAPFLFSDQLTLWVVPFDLDAEQLVEGNWLGRCGWYTARPTALAA